MLNQSVHTIHSGTFFFGLGGGLEGFVAAMTSFVVVVTALSFSLDNGKAGSTVDSAALASPL